MNSKNLIKVCIILFIIFSPYSFAPVHANVPTLVQITVSQKATGSIITLTVNHLDPSSVHYVDTIEVEINGVMQRIENLQPQSQSTFSYEFNAGKIESLSSVRARANCNLHGWSDWYSLKTTTTTTSTTTTTPTTTTSTTTPTTTTTTNPTTTTQTTTTTTIQTSPTTSTSTTTSTSQTTTSTSTSTTTSSTTTMTSTPQPTEPVITLATINILVQIILMITITVGVILAKKKKFKMHHNYMTVLILINAVTILIVMGPSLISLLGHPSKTLTFTTTASMIHGLLGGITEMLGLIIIFKKPKNLKMWMRTIFALWTTSFILGIVLYIIFYMS